MSDMQRESPPGLYVPEPKVTKPFDPLDWVLYALVLSVGAGVITGWRTDDWWLGGATAGSLYIVALLTIIALKN